MSDNNNVNTYLEKDGEQGKINISEDVIVYIVAAAALEIEGVKSLASNVGVDIAEFLGKKNVAKGVKIQIIDNKISADVYVIVKYGYVIPNVAKKIQNAVYSAVESMTGLKVGTVTVHVSSVSIDNPKE